MFKDSNAALVFEAINRKLARTTPEVYVVTRDHFALRLINIYYFVFH